MHDVVVIGAGQAGLATSWWLTERQIDHVVLEAAEIGQTWRTRRWRSFRLVSPNSLNLLPGAEYDGPEPDAFLSAGETADYLEDYARSFDPPIRRGVAVRALRLLDDGRFDVEHDDGRLTTRAVVIATGAFGDPRIPQLAADFPTGILQLHSDDYWDPESLPGGGVLVVGSGQSGSQIADEVALAGRDTWLAVGRFGWVPRRLYDTDHYVWRWKMGDFANVVNEPDEPETSYPSDSIARSGADDFHAGTLVDHGVRLTGRVVSVTGQRVHIADDLLPNLVAADEQATTVAGRVREYAASVGVDVEPTPPILDCWADRPMPRNPSTLDLAKSGIRTVIWGTGYRHDFGWIHAPTFAANGAPYQRQGQSRVEGLAFMGLHRMHAAASGTLLGVGPDSRNVVAVLAKHLGVTA